MACRASLTWEAAEVTTNDGGANAKPTASDPREPFFGDQGFLLWQGGNIAAQSAHVRSYPGPYIKAECGNRCGKGFGEIA